jgi:hypothetical protein
MYRIKRKITLVSVFFSLIVFLSAIGPFPETLSQRTNAQIMPTSGPIAQIAQPEQYLPNKTLLSAEEANLELHQLPEKQMILQDREQEIVVEYTPPWIEGSGPAMRGTLVAQTERLDIYAGSNTFSHERLAELAPFMEQLLREDENRLGTEINKRLSVGFYSLGSAPYRGVRGLAYTDVGTSYVYYYGHESSDSAMIITAHEIAHHLEVARYNQEIQNRADTILHEGLATWITGERWYGRYGVSSWREQAQRLNNSGIPLNLLNAERYGANPAYELWASFCDYLIQQYGWEAFDQIYSSGNGRRPGTASYQAVYGKNLTQLADEWRNWVRQ